MSQTFAKIIACLVISLALFGGGFFTAHLIAKARSTVLIREYEARLADLTNLNTELQAINSALVESNTNLGATNARLNSRLRESEARIGKAKEIVAGIADGLESDGEIVQRLIDTISRVADLVSIISE